MFLEAYKPSEVKQHLVTKSNALIEANYRLTLTEQKIVLYLVSHIRKDDDDFKTYVLPIKEFHELLGLQGSTKYTEIREITKGLMSKVLEIREEKKLIQIGWLSYVEYNEQTRQITLSFDPRLKPYLLQLKREFTSYRLKNVMELNSTYSIRMYEILKKWQLIKEIVLPLEEFKKTIGIDKKYSEYHNFKKRVLKPAEKEIAEKTDISFSYTEIKSGRKVTALKFTIQSQINQDKALLEQPLQLWIPLLEGKGYQVTPVLLDRWQQLARQIWPPEEYTAYLDSLVSESLRMPAVQNHLAFITHVMNQKKEAIDKGNDPEKITPKSLSGHSFQKEVLPKWFVDEAEETEEFDAAFMKQKKALEEQLKARKKR